MLLDTRVGRPADVRGSASNASRSERTLYFRSDREYHANPSTLRPEYDYVVVNRDLDRAFGDVRAILHAERLKRERQTGLSAFVRGLQQKL